jgi:hypothetical protein
VRGLTESDLLPIWERGEAGGPVEQAEALLAAALPEVGPDELDGLSIGQRDVALLTLHRLTFGPRVDGFVQCPECGEALEIGLGPDELGTLAAAEPSLGEQELVADGHRLRFRPLACGDLRAAAAAAGPDEARLALVRRCVLDPVDPATLPDGVVSVLAERLAECDPQADIGLPVTCPACEHAWRPVLDIAAFLWTEVSAEARRLLEEVHTLAASYGWREPEILALSARRRRFYLELVA